MRGFWRNPYTWALCAWTGVIFFSSTSLAEVESERGFSYISHILSLEKERAGSFYQIVHFLADKGVHVFLFSVLGLLLWQVVPETRYKIWIIFLAGTLIASCSEFLQRFFPGRDPAVADVLINLCGTAIGVSVRLAFITIGARRRCDARFVDT